MKKLLIYLIGLPLILLLLAVFTLAGILFFRPTWIINPTTIDLVVRRAHVLKGWSWKEGVIEHQWVSWNRRIVKGHYSDLCIDYENSAFVYGTCFEKISWNFDLAYDWDNGFYSKTIEPLFIRSSMTKIALKENQQDSPAASPPDIWGYWRLLWSETVPDIDGQWKKISFEGSARPVVFDLRLQKILRKLDVAALQFSLHANPQGFEILAPKKYPFPKKLSFLSPLHFRNVKLKGKVQKHEVPLHLTGALESIRFDVKSKLDLPIGDNFQKKIILATKANIHLPDIKKTLANIAKDPFRELPAPLNAMEGGVEINLHTEDMNKKDFVLIKLNTALSMKGGKQVLDLVMKNDVPLNIVTLRPGAVEVGIDFNKVALQLPRISKKSLPPQFFPDARFKQGPYRPAVKVKPKINLAMHFEALQSEAMVIKSDLLDENLRLNFDLYVEEGQLQNGFISLFPLKTTVFRRPIQFKSFRLNFNHPQEPVLSGKILFPLPEYKITLDLEGPISKPRYKFSSQPPLQLNDIYSVLLFGRPMDDLDQTDKTSAQKTNQILAQGILSLSVLYFFAGSPVEYIGFNPETRKTTAQFGINAKTSLNVGRDQEGVNSSGIRRSLGKGWYLDTTVQGPSSNSTSTQQNYGVILERILAY